MRLYNSIPEYEKLYYISINGNVYDSRTNTKLPTFYNKKNSFLLFVRLCKNNKYKNYSLSHLLGITFIKNDNNIRFSYKDGNYKNNNINNIIEIGCNVRPIKLIFKDYEIQFSSLM